MNKLVDIVVDIKEGIQKAWAWSKRTFVLQVRIPLIRWKNKWYYKVLNKIYQYRIDKATMDELLFRAKLFSNMGKPAEYLVLDNFLFPIKRWFYMYKVRHRIRKTYKMHMTEIASKYFPRKSLITYDDYYNWLYMLPKERSLDDYPFETLIPALVKVVQGANKGTSLDSNDPDPSQNVN